MLKNKPAEAALKTKVLMNEIYVLLLNTSSALLIEIVWKLSDSNFYVAGSNLNNCW